MPAVVGAHVGDGEGNAVIVLSGDAVGSDLVSITILLPDQVVWNPITVFFFLHGRYNLLSDRAVGIIAIHQGGKVRGCPPLSVERGYALLFLRGYIDVLLELFKGIHTVL